MNCSIKTKQLLKESDRKGSRAVILLYHLPQTSICLSVCLSIYLDGWMYVCVNAWMNGWMNVWMDGTRNGRMNVYVYVCIIYNLVTEY